MNWQIGFTSIAEKRIAKIPQPDRRRILMAIDRLHDGLVGDIKPLKGKTNQWRLRVGGWRIVFAADTLNRIVIIKYVDVRGDVYKN